jgi:RNA polymerase sigma-70 factor (ECF subfamily)
MARVAFCAAVDESRRLRRRKEVALEASMDAPGPETEQPSRAARSGEIRSAIRECLVAISEKRSLAVTLYLQGHTAPQTARILGWSLTRTENLIYRGMADLRRCLARKGVTP